MLKHHGSTDGIFGRAERLDTCIDTIGYRVLMTSAKSKFLQWETFLKLEMLSASLPIVT